MRPDQASVVPSSVVASVSTFTDAQQTVDYLRSYGMDSRSLEVVGAELRLSRRQAAVPVVRRTFLSAGAGALLGVLSGVFVTLVAETTLTAFSVLLWGFVYGVLVGALWGLFQGLVRNRPDAPAVEVIVPSYYEVRCAVEDVSVALSLLGPEPEPVFEPEPALASRLLVEPPVRRVAEPEPVLVPQPVVELEPVAEREPAAEREPVAVPKPVAASRHLVEPPPRRDIEREPRPEPKATARPKPQPKLAAPVAEEPTLTIPVVEQPSTARPKPEPELAAPVAEEPTLTMPVVEQSQPRENSKPAPQKPTVADSAPQEPAAEQKPPVRRQPAQTTRKTRAKKKTARTNAA